MRSTPHNRGQKAPRRAEFPTNVVDGISFHGDLSRRPQTVQEIAFSCALHFFPVASSPLAMSIEIFQSFNVNNYARETPWTGDCSRRKSKEVCGQQTRPCCPTEALSVNPVDFITRL